MSVPGHYKGQITRAINSLRRKNADVDPALFEQFDPAGTPDTHEFLMSSYQELRSSLEQFWSIWYKDYLQALAEKIQIYASPKRGSRDWPKEQQRWLQPRCQREALRFSRSMDVPAIDGWTRPAESAIESMTLTSSLAWMGSAQSLEATDRSVLPQRVCSALRPRGIGLIRLPFGVSDHRSGPYLPNLYIAGNKLYHRTQSIPDVSLPGQDKDFSGHAQFNPFTHMTGVASNMDFGDSWGAGYALQGDLTCADIIDNMLGCLTFLLMNSFIVGAEVDSSKYVSHAVALDIPIPGLNEVGVSICFNSSMIKKHSVVFDFQEETLMKRDEELIDIHHTRFSLPIPSTDQRLPFKAHSFERFNDIDLNFAQVLPSLNNHNIKTDDIVDELITNRANPGLVG
ncbi:hypothetical protein ANCCEY_11672 [Ancylostoma ceylanicum]|uniref:Uncharacterized protein n=1 Tax=Ancylostoma ceylanicum TaxID=53326 RepID=A0A0D6LNL4_9BILA|nr:hypothetical protein ANCCEY_11672 [Ancylostoma ceylanicum]